MRYVYQHPASCNTLSIYLSIILSADSKLIHLVCARRKLPTVSWRPLWQRKNCLPRDDEAFAEKGMCCYIWHHNGPEVIYQDDNVSKSHCFVVKSDEVTYAAAGRHTYRHGQCTDLNCAKYLNERHARQLSFSYNDKTMDMQYHGESTFLFLCQ